MTQQQQGRVVVRTPGSKALIGRQYATNEDIRESAPRDDRGLTPYSGLGLLGRGGQGHMKEPALAAATTARVHSIPTGAGANNLWAVFLTYDTNTEVRKITGVSNSTDGVDITWSGGLTYAHAAGDAVMFLSDKRLNVKWFGATGDGSTDDTASILAASQQSNDIFLPAGTYVISGRIVNKTTAYFTMRGEGRGQTIIKILDDLTNPVISITGVTGESGHINFYLFEDFTVWNPSRTYEANVIETYYINQMTLNRVFFTGIKGHAIKLVETWDSYLSDLQFLSCGDPDDSEATILLDTSDPDSETLGCNNIHMFGLQIEQSYYYGMEWGDNTRKTHLIGSKFHGILPSPAAYHSLYINGDGVNSNNIIGTTFANCGDSHIAIDGEAYANSIIGCNFNGGADWAIDIINGTANAADGNIFGGHNANTNGSFRVQAGSNNTYGFTNISYDATPVSGAGRGRIKNDATTTDTLELRAGSSQTGDLVAVYNTGGTKITSISPAGNINAPLVNVTGATSTTFVNTAKVTGDSANRLQTDAAGKISWGTGSAAMDTNLYRGGADVLRTDDTLRANLLRVEVLTAAPGTPANGMIVYADGSTWDPGSGAGFYGYQAGAWVKL